MAEKINVIVNGKKVKTETGESIANLLPQVVHAGKWPAIAALANNRLVGLYHDIRTSTEIGTLDLTSREGTEVYRRTAQLIFFAALTEIYPNAKVEVGQSIGNGYFLEITNIKGGITSGLIERLEREMQRIIKSDMFLRPIWIPIEEAIAHFSKLHRHDRVVLLKQLRKSEAQVVDVGSYRGLVYGPVAYRTSLIDHLRLHRYMHGLVLEFPSTDGSFLGRVQTMPKLFNVYLETRKWNKLIRVENVAQLNDECAKGNASDLVKVAEALHEKKITAIADEIHRNKNVKLILVAGPSASGKTTFMKRLRGELRVNGIEPVAISIDNYYLNREDSPKRKDGSFDFETIGAIDTALFNKHVMELLDGKEVETPIYSFSAGRRSLSRRIKMKLKPHQVLITEGLHGLNEKLSSRIPRKNKFKIYVSALTQLCIDDHNRILTSDARLLRRIVRDRLFRGAGAAESLAMWPCVRSGENVHIFKYQEDADVMFNSALVYEPALLKPYAERFLMEVPREHPSFVEALRLFRFLDLLIPILPQEIPQTSILREFIGGSAFRH